MTKTNDPASARDRAGQRRKRLIIGIVLATIAVHLLFGGVAAIWVIARYFEKPKAQFTVEKIVRIEPEPRDHQISMQELESLRQRPVVNNRILSLRPTELSLPDLPKLVLDQSVPLDTAALVNAQIDSVSSSASGQGSSAGGGFFGSAVKQAGAFEGYFYDLKSLANGSPSEVEEEKNQNKAYLEVLADFVKSNWSSSKLDRYFKAEQPLYSVAFLMPKMDAAEAPEAFSVDRPPRRWAALYRGSAAFPTSGRYRFVGTADDVLVVRAKGELVLNGSYPSCRRVADDDLTVETKDGKGVKFYFGPWIDVSAGEAVPIEILLGEQPGGVFYCFLGLEKEGEEYAQSGNNLPLIPAFQIAPLPDDWTQALEPDRPPLVEINKIILEPKKAFSPFGR